MSWTRTIAENRIQEAIENGEFDDLPGKGKPLDLSDYFNTPAAERMGLSVLKSASVLPPEMELLREIEALEKRLSTCCDESSRNRIREEIHTKRTGFTMSMERRSRAMRGNVSLENGMI